MSFIRFLEYRVLKRLFDFLFSLFLIIFLIPLFFIIGILIRVNSKGDIIYSQKRIGKNNKTFAFYKFRTMHPQAKYLLKKILQNNYILKNLKIQEK